MTPEKWLEVKEIFNVALDLPPGERRSFIEKRCADNELREEVEALLASADEAEDFIEDPALTRVSHLVTAEKMPSYIGKQIGAYKIEKEIGKGGMGAVYLARRADREFDKKVAIKLIKRGFDTDEIIERFRHERQILAALEHPNITRLIDGGSTEDDLPYLVMDYVEGLPLNKYCAVNAVSLDARLDIFLKICSAVTYAHQNLIIHRDLKPSNVIVSDDGTPKLLDFGIAKLTAPNSSATLGAAQTTFRVMTPEYASPEQVNGQVVTTASDIYSLGVVLYELLTGQRPFRIRTNSAQEISRIITDTSPTRPSESLRRGEEEKGRKGEEIKFVDGKISSTPQLPFSLSQLKGDLDNIILMAMRKEPERRYSSVEQFAEDIRRYLNGLPVIAREDSFGYRAEKFVKRNKAGVAAGLGIALSLVGGLIATSRQAKIAKKQRDRALRETEKAERINQFLQKMLNSADPRTGSKDVKVIEVLGVAAESIEKDFANQPEIAADLETTLGLTYLSLGHLDSAEKCLKNALDTRLLLFPRVSEEVALSLRNYGRLLQAKGELKRAEPLFIESLETLRRLRGDLNLDVADVLTSLAYLETMKGENARAVKIYEKEIMIRREILGENHADVARNLSRLGNVLTIMGRGDLSEPIYRQSLKILEKIHGREHLDIAASVTDLIGVVNRKNFEEAEELARKALAMRRKFLGEDHADVAWSLYNLTYVLVNRDKFTEAEQTVREALGKRGTNVPDEHPVVSSSFLLLGRSLLGQDKFSEAKKAFEECLRLREKTLPEGHWLLATVRSFLGETLAYLGETATGKRLLSENYEILKEKLGKDHEQTLQALERLEKINNRR
ncbi:MAG TPA: serine/threonine-protein kinase [Pyrinomonadaceae bacterium]|nr:serine/threonine-protein kinase [Pyrinomonadaceae bacterium]